MAKKEEERDWSEIIAEVRSKAKLELEEVASEIHAKVEEVVAKVRSANFHEEAEQFLSRVRNLADDFSHSEEGPSSSVAKPKTGKAKRPPMYRTPDGKEYSRALKGWTEAEKEKFRIK
ncbi:hypothetical protein [Aestuariicoccus sp. MJ-SS9]|uniref:hypothetical protein n=1 Tax=Aestuariicoccus sp. MJ-SS9 TaxID=3079855 RepID=UPI002909B8C7|nr:hypothetical protein [Aestuariicoccus sp. MJ-SS9]MDU8909747.1 hypothetical protein [Aestuariicoccus sp. MJ-SS9]